MFDDGSNLIIPNVGNPQVWSLYVIRIWEEFITLKLRFPENEIQNYWKWILNPNLTFSISIQKSSKLESNNSKFENILDFENWPKFIFEILNVIIVISKVKIYKFQA